MFRWKRIEIAAAMALLMTLLLSAVYVKNSCEIQNDMAQKMVRLHVLANSDEDYDQARKLLVKDAIFARTEELLRQAESQKEAEHLLESALSELEVLAEETLRADGHAENVEIVLTDTGFSTRYYEGFTLPAGEYRSLQVTIGEGAGRNWWCVVFPPLCSAGVESLDSAAERAGLTPEEIDLIRGGEERYVLRFRSMEIWNALREFLRQNCA